MIDSPLKKLVEKRKQSLSAIDQKDFSESYVINEQHWPTARPRLSEKLKRHPGSKARILAEIKKKSPSLGELSSESAEDLCHRYIDSGCHGISILVDQVNFSGHPNDLRRCVEKFPDQAFLFKDFVTTEYQVYLARAIGASAILLMTQVLDQEHLEQLFHLSVDLGLEAFVEVHDQNQLKRALSLNPPLLGVNARDFEKDGMPVDLNTMPELWKKNKPNTAACITIAQSGIASKEDLETLEKDMPENTPDAFQIGSSLCASNQLPDWLIAHLSAQ